MDKVSDSYHLLRRNGVWYYRRRVPDDLRESIGKRLIQFSLRTANKVQAAPVRLCSITSVKEGTEMKSMLASMAVVLTSCAFQFCAFPAASADFPKTGEAEYDTYYVGNTVAKFDSGAGTGAIVDETGITRNVKGEGPFHDMSVRCLFHRSSVGETVHLNGSCVETDKDGDNVFTTFDDKNHYLMGGTGKYKGIMGTVPYTVVELHETVGGRTALIVNHKATWEIK